MTCQARRILRSLHGRVRVPCGRVLSANHAADRFWRESLHRGRVPCGCSLKCRSRAIRCTPMSRTPFLNRRCRTPRRLDRLVKDGTLYITLKDAIDLALEDNLDLAIARYNLPIANTDILRTKAGGFFRGVNTGVVQGTPGGGVGGFGTGAPGAGAGGTTGGAGGAGAGASGLVQSTLGAGTAVSSFDPLLNVNGGVEHQTTPLANRQIYGVPLLQLNTGQVDCQFFAIISHRDEYHLPIRQLAADDE